MQKLLLLASVVVGLTALCGCSHEDDKLEVQAPPPGPNARPDVPNPNKRVPSAPGAPAGGNTAAMGAPGVVR